MSNNRDGTPLLKERIHTKEIAWLIYGPDSAVLEKSMRPASKSRNAL